MDMRRLENDLLTNKYTSVYHEEKFNFNAPHTFEVISAQDESEPPVCIQRIHFQEGPIKENGINGIHNEDLISMVICRLEHFNNSEFKCRENAVAITKLEEALLWLRKRTINRENRGVEGTNIK